MASSEFFLPYSLSKLVDDNPFIKTENYSQNLNIQVLKQDILENLKMIFASKSHLQIKEENLAKSVLCCGVDDFSGEAINDENIDHFISDVIQKIIYFEPRIDPHSIVVINLTRDNQYIYNIKLRANLILVDEEMVFDMVFDFSSSNCKIGYIGG